jgi:hypothetical protein
VSEGRLGRRAAGDGEIGVGRIVRACLNNLDRLGRSQGNRLKNRPPWHHEGSGAGSERERKCVERFSSGVIVDVIHLRTAGIFMHAGLRIRMRMDQGAVIVILMNVLERR